MGNSIVKGNSGNRYAIEAAEMVCLSNHSDILAVICQMFWDRGRQGVLEMIEDWQTEWPFINRVFSDSSLSNAALEKEQKAPSYFEVVTPNNQFSLIERSEVFRGQVRGVAIGRLG